MCVLPYSRHINNDLLCLHENNYQNIVMVLVLSDDLIRTKLKVYIYESSMLVLFCFYSNSFVRDKLVES